MATIASAIIAPAAWNQVERSSASLQTNSEVAGLGLRSMLTPQISDVWRLAPAAVGQVVLMVDVGLDTVAQLVLLAAPRDGVLPLTGSTWRIVCSRTDGTQVYDSGALPLEPVPRALWPHVLPQPVTARYWRITFDFAAGQPYAQFGRLLIQPALVTTRAISYGQQRGVVDAGSNALCHARCTLSAAVLDAAAPDHSRSRNVGRHRACCGHHRAGLRSAVPAGAAA
jgi:hypothetical protein